MPRRRKIGTVTALPSGPSTAVTEPHPLEGYSPDFLACRVDRHRWGSAVWELLAGNISERIRQCTVCGSKVVQTINTRTWRQLGYKRYRYAPGYTKRGMGLVLADFTEAHLRGDFERARGDGRMSG